MMKQRGNAYIIKVFYVVWHLTTIHTVVGKDACAYYSTRYRDRFLIVDYCVYLSAGIN